jgi:hypothetical protein
MPARLRVALLASFALGLIASAVFAATHLPALVASRAALPAPSVTLQVQPVVWKPNVSESRSFSPEERRKIEAAVRAQIRAYAAGNAEQAFATLAPSAQRFFGKPDHFLRWIVQDVPAVLDTKHFAFLGVERSGDRAVQQVLITDGSGREWLAEFQLERQRTGEWRIRSCVVEPTPGQQA